MRFGVVASLLVSVVVSAFSVHGIYTAGQASVTTKWAKAEAEQANAVAHALQQLAEQAHQLDNQLAINATQHQKEQTHAAQEINRLRAAVRAGTLRLSVPAQACPSGDRPEGANNDAGQARAELDPATADALVSIAADGDRAIRDLNACIEQYNAVRSAINGAQK